MKKIVTNAIEMIIADFIKDKHGIDYVDIKKEENPYQQLSIWDIKE